MAEIAIATAGMVISPIVQVFFERMASGDFVDLFRGRKLDDGLLMRLKIKLLSVNAVLKDAEDKQFTRPDVKVWVDAVYDAEQVLDDVSTKAQQHKWDAEFENSRSKLQNIESPSNAEGRSLRDLKYLKKLELGWNGDTNASESHKIVLNNLQPHTNLGSLTIKGYGGISFSYWVGDASFSNIAPLSLEKCKFCCSLPPLGQLPSLQKLLIVGLDGVVTIDRQFYGSGSHSMKPFGALKSLFFSKMLEWKEWSHFEAENEGRAFPNLRVLRISNCPKLTSGLPAHLPSLDKLVIYNCPQLVASIPRASSLRELDFSNCNTVLLNESPTGI